MYLIDKDSVAVRVFHPFGHGVDPPLTKLRIQHIEFEDLIAMSQLARFRIRSYRLRASGTELGNAQERVGILDDLLN